MNFMNSDNQLLKKLAIAITENPRGTSKELAEAVGISKATLHRFCGTRENLDKMLTEKAFYALKEIIETAQEEFDDYRAGIKQLIEVHFKNHEFLRYVVLIPSLMEHENWQPYLNAIDSFFLRGQKQGVFKIDFGVSFLTEIFVSSICSLIDAERRGRIASNGINNSFEYFFLKGSEK